MCVCKVEKLQDMPVEERKAKAAAVSGSRLLTQDEFKKIRMVQLAKEINAAPGKGQKRSNVDFDDEDDNRLESYFKAFTKIKTKHRLFVVCGGVHIGDCTEVCTPFFSHIIKGRDPDLEEY